jgi:uncharacterized protein
MPVRSLNSSVMRWPGRTEVTEAVRSWARAECPRHPGVMHLGYFGSYARGDWGVGSDLDLIAVVGESADPVHRRARSWAIETLPVPADLLVYTAVEWDRVCSSDTLFARTIRKETVWVYP